ncbi:NADP oxidoreductase [Thermosipho melanesiensis]|uniref:NADH dehydrogenase (Quinone) n=2 Tax=Thermosipho melanesiensis TaxID=46541 RepID=A6LM71_THEM4|nr:NADH-quinone oxidoreductase subunit NuoF [Thermosipho melanesiensis]ABR31022.1 NADH dehydrogenase (quinone) [Thermosipho melanesiensis BI429]APT74116.1 NADP oxidoreductase [Thermosipho melanesiensis]OOC36064.1 NADP oxidoreductase [Thermosipho melanesiensis]OOC36881.1 NADP oxidoreductase [Thermosipho melanesiensis]OOC37632.1 NADP oxidoreductase [Thermosipho melanesiensis]
MKPITILVSIDSNSVLLGAKEFLKYLKELTNEYNLDKIVDILETGTIGNYKGVTIAIMPDNVFYSAKTKDDVKKIFEEHILKGRKVLDLEINPKELQQTVEKLTKEVKIVTRNIGKIDPKNIEEYIANDGYFALAKAFKMKPHEIIEEIKESGLRGRGGAGFPTGLKWEFAFKTQSDQKYIVCNADEGEPGTYKDRLIMEGDPHSVIEAMIIAGYAVGATKGYIYIRGEYYGSVENIKKAIKDAYEYGFLGENILNSNFNFDLSVRLGAGAYICGEETALLESIEGNAGRPRLKPPYPPQSGLFGKPTVINNVETLANVPQIILNGAKWFKQFGTENSPGTKVFCFTGNLNNRGIVELPMGVTVRELLVHAGGVSGDKLKMVQTGGIAGTFIDESKFDIPLDYDSFAKYSVSLGSGVILGVNNNHCVVDIAKNVMEFFRHESCGKCTPCREGTKMVVKILDKMSKLEANKEDLERLVEIANTAKETALCGLGQSFPVPLLSLINNFKEEFLDHIENKNCIANLCKKVERKKKKSKVTK